MTVGRERKVETRFARRALAGRGLSLNEGVAAAQVRIEGMREDARERIGEMLQQMQSSRPAVAQGDEAAIESLRTHADALVGLCDLFGLPEVGAAALSVCKLFDACRPDLPAAEGICVHLDALQMFWSLPSEMLAECSPQVLEGLRQVAVAARRQPDAA